jgi:outer membrane biosynthesis protein TonB
MRMDRAEWTGTGAALLFHVALIGAMSMSLAHVTATPEPPAMEVEFVEDIGLTSAAPQSIPVPPPPSQAPEIGEAEPVEAPPQAPPPPTPAPVVKPAPAKSAVPAKPAPTKPSAPAKPAPRVSRIGDDFLKGIGESRSNAPPRPAAPTFSAQARASVASSIARQVQPCADRQPYIGEGADQVQISLKLYLTRAGRLSRPPVISSMAGPSEFRAKYGELLEDQVRRIFADCSPFRLPAELYDTDDGGWKETSLRYRVKK